MRSNSSINSKTCNSRRNFAYRNLAPMRRYNMLDESTLSFSLTFPHVSFFPSFLPFFLFNQNSNDTHGGRRLPRKKSGKLPRYSKIENFSRPSLSFLPRKIKMRQKLKLKEVCVHTHDERSIPLSLVRLLKMSKNNS